MAGHTLTFLQWFDHHKKSVKNTNSRTVDSLQKKKNEPYRKV